MRRDAEGNATRVNVVGRMPDAEWTGRRYFANTDNTFSKSPTVIGPAFAPALRSSLAHPRKAAFGFRPMAVRIGSSELRVKL